jgi:hypothetical protein
MVPPQTRPIYPAAAAQESHVPAERSHPVSNGTVAGTGMADSVGQKTGVQVRDMNGAGDTDRTDDPRLMSPLLFDEFTV